MRFDILTIFPNCFESYFNESIIKKAREKKKVTINIINFREYSKNKHRCVDDAPYGGGSGMVLTPEPLANCLDDSIKKSKIKPYIIYLSAQGKLYNQKIAKNFSRKKHIVLICGHYEGIDERIIEEYVDCEISIGDYVLTGGEIPAMILVDSITRLIKGVLGNSESLISESFEDNLLDYPQYTRPQIFHKRRVPKVLLSGNHKEIAEFRRQKRIEKTKKVRPDLL
jgi:tRNA (guanine37-N1)-methyltransferase